MARRRRTVEVPETPDYVLSNRRHWDDQAIEYATWADQAWQSEPSWGIWHVPEDELRLLAGVAGKTVLEDGCGTAYISAHIARAGGSPVGLDNSPAQLATASRMQLKHGPRFPLIHGIAEQLPFRDESFDLVISEYGAAIWSDPYLWIPEAARVLKLGGELVFLGNSALFMLFAAEEEDMPAGTTMIRDHFGMRRFEWPDSEEIEFHLGHGQNIRLLRDSGFEILDLIELRAPEGAVSSYPYVPYDWARRWPSEEVWRARKVGS